jgi:hypothetical protein
MSPKRRSTLVLRRFFGASIGSYHLSAQISLILRRLCTMREYYLQTAGLAS